MIPESKLKADCTPEIIKKMVELAEGFEYKQDEYYKRVLTMQNFRCNLDCITTWILFPFLIHRAVEGWNKNEKSDLKEIIVYNNSVKLIEYKESREGGFDPFAIVVKKIENYQPESLTPCECACLHCLIEIFKEEIK